jgi:hypothetical protein
MYTVELVLVLSQRIFYFSVPYCSLAFGMGPRWNSIPLVDSWSRSWSFLAEFHSSNVFFVQEYFPTE